VRIKVGITIDAPPRAVWDVVEPVERHVDWMHDAVSITFTGSRRRGVGTTFDCLTRVGPFRTVDSMTITEWIPGAVMGIEHTGAVSGRGRFVLRARGRGRTRFTWTERLRFPWWMGGPLGALAAKPVLRRIWHRNLGALKQLVESRSV
jgi:uncharacterized protein YndB with AHSA1/START domain